MNRWSVEREDKLRALKAEGRTHKQIAEAFGSLTKSAISKKCKSLGIGTTAVLSPWTDEIRNDVVGLRALGLSSKTIAIRLGAPFTRNAVCGMLARLQNASGQRLDQGPKAAAAPRPPKPQVAKPHTPKVVRLEHVGFSECRWPMWEKEGAPEFFVCGNKAHPGSSWCEHHAARVFQPVRARHAAKEVV